MAVVEQCHRTARLDHRIQPAQRLGAIHPVEGAAHDHQAKAAERRREIVGTALAKHDLRGEPGGGRFGFAQHRRFRINRHHLAREIREADRERAGSAAEIEHTMFGADAHALGDATDQQRRVRGAAGAVMRRGGAEAVRVERQRVVCHVDARFHHPAPNRPDLGNPFGGSLPACARSPSQGRKSVSVRTRSPSLQLRPCASVNTRASRRPPR